MIRAVVFDLWNTLVHSRGGDPFRHLQDYLTPSQIIHLEALEQDAMSRIYASAEALLEGWQAPLGLTDEQRMAMALMLRESASDAECYPETLKALEATRQLARVALLSNTQSYDLEFIEVLGLSERLPHRFLSAELGVLKPEASAFQAVQKRLGLFPGELAMVGDSWRADVQGALQAGWTAIWLNRDGAPRPDCDPDAELVEIRDLASVPVVIAALQAGARCSTCLG